MTSKTCLTYADWAQRLDAQGKVPTIIEMLNQDNAILDDMQLVECNNGTSHKTTIRTGIPEATWRRLNYGVPRAKSTTVQIEDATGMLEVYSEVDKALADLNGNTAAFRLSESRAFLEGMNQQMAHTLIYGNELTHADQFTGLAARYNDLSAPSGENVVDAGGAGEDNASVWLMQWGEAAAHGLFPKGSKAGLQHEDKGQETLSDEVGGLYEGYRDHYKWDLGFTLRDWRSCARVANIDVSLLRSDMDYLKALIGHMIDASEAVKRLGGNMVWYANKTVSAALRRAILEKVATNLSFETVEGKPVTMFDGITLKRVDQLSNAENRVI